MCLYFIQNFEIKRVNDKNGQKDKLQTFIRWKKKRMLQNTFI
jgi:hypothetical protein